MSIDSATLTKLQYQARRMHFALEHNDQREADAVQRRVDQILDERPRVFAVATDGETIYDNASPWIKAQVSTVVNTTGVPEKVFGLSDVLEREVIRQAELILGADDPEDGGTAAGGGVGVLDRP